LPMPRRRRDTQRAMRDGIALASSCTSCAGQISNPPAWAPGRHMAPIHASHMPELQALGWVVTEYPEEPPDVACPHYHAAYWQDG
jgi:hypothetical protein